MEQQEFRDALKYNDKTLLLLKQHSYEEILEQAAAFLRVSPEALENQPADYLAKGMTGATYRLVLKDLLKNIHQFEWVYSKLADRRSKLVFANLMLFRIVPQRNILQEISDETDGLCYEDGSREEETAFLNIEEKGLEIPSLLDAKRPIREDFPKLAVCVSDIVSDLWEIPRLIDAIHPDYRFYFRYYDASPVGKVICYAIPPEVKKLEKPVPRKEKRVVALAAFDGWQDLQLVKECGTIPYLLYKNHGCRSSMLGAKLADEYHNLRYVEGLRMEFLPDGEMLTKADYIKKHAKEIDALLLRGPYNTYYYPAKCYKECNPFGRIYLSLDPNPYWMDILDWKDPFFSEFLDHCDIIGSSDRVMQQHLMEKWRWEIDYYPNGFYDFTGGICERPFEEKKNTILTVGRLGTEQKATHVLLEAFARISDQIPDWELRLAGTIDPSFEPYLNDFWEKYPELKDRIHFIGRISEREALYEEYLSAKIFALSSELEGGLPNVVSEAMTMGCAVAITRIHAHEEATDSGRCGMSADVADIPGFADILLQMCTGGGLKQMCEHARAYALEVFDMEKITERLYHRLFGEESA